MPTDNVAAALDPATRVDLIADRIREAVIRFDAARDERAVFAFVYLLITRNLAGALRAGESGFDDPSWVARLTEAFAGRFFIGMDAIDRGDARAGTPPWADVHEAIRGGQSYVLEDLVFSMMAHISYDLPLAVLEVGLETSGASHVADYHRMNKVLAERTESIQDAVAERYNSRLAILDWIAGRYDEFFSNYGIRATRSVAWYNAIRVQDPRSAGEARGSIERSTANFIRFVREPEELWLRLLIAVARFLLPRRRRWPRQPPE
ncbi:MAG: DUF5995 family protein [Bryobacteraceae bacterium]